MVDNDIVARLLVPLLAVGVVSLIVFLILRELMCWYYKINTIVSLLEDIKNSLSHGGSAPGDGSGSPQTGRTGDGVPRRPENGRSLLGLPSGALEGGPDEIAPRSAEDSFNKGVDLLESDKPAEAQDLFDEALGMNPQDSDTWFWKGECLLRLGSHEEALACFDRAAAFNATDAKPLYGKARALDGLGRTQKAAKLYSAYLAKAPQGDEWTDVARRRLKEIEQSGGH